MAKQTVNIGTSANDRTGDSLRSAFSKINANFTELYTQLGLDVDGLNLGAFEFSGSTMTTTDSSAITIAQALTVTSDITIGGDIIPNVNEEHNLGSSTRRFKDLYLSSNTIDLGGTTLSIVGGNLQVGGTDIKDVVTAAGVDYGEIQNTPDLSNYVQQGDRLDSDLTGSVFGDDSTLLVDGVNGRIKGSIIDNTINVEEEADFIINTSGTQEDTSPVGVYNNTFKFTAQGELIFDTAFGEIKASAGGNLNIQYIEGTPSHWSSSPDTIKDALDRIAAAIYAVNGGTPI